MARHARDDVYPGTYVKVVASAGPSTNQRDSFRVLDLRPNGRFLFLGYWPGYERSVASGQWSVADEIVELDGFGRIDGDALGNPDPGRFRRTFTYSVSNFTPILMAEEELPGWSLLSWAGAYSYIRWEVVFDPGRGWLPQSINAVDELIDRSLQ
jgi:hypothetical protein